MSLPPLLQLCCLDNDGTPLDLSGGGVCYNSLSSLDVYPSGQVIASFAAGVASIQTDSLYLPDVDHYDDDPED